MKDLSNMSRFRCQVGAHEKSEPFRMGIFEDVEGGWNPIPCMRTYKERAQEFRNRQEEGKWRVDADVFSNAIARAGFKFLEEPDVIMCAACGVRFHVMTFDSCTDYLKKHFKESPACMFIRTLEIPELYFEWECFEHHAHLHMADSDMRLETFAFDDVWCDGTHPCVIELSEAGFFVPHHEEDISDVVACYSCGVELDSWEIDDMPWEEHVKAHPICRHLIEQKGMDYIRSVRRTNAIRVYAREAMQRQRAANFWRTSHTDVEQMIDCVAATHSFQSFRELAFAVCERMNGEEAILQQKERERMLQTLQTSPAVRQVEGIRRNGQTSQRASPYNIGSRSHIQDAGRRRDLGTSMLQFPGNNSHSTYESNQELLAAAASALLFEDDIEETSVENSDEKDDDDDCIADMTCVICKTAQKRMAYSPCYHLAACESCAKKLNKYGKGRCPVCNKKVKGVKKVYY